MSYGVAMQQVRFNTGRAYTAQGQRITATLHTDSVVTFNDHDRHVHGEFKLASFASFDQHTVLFAYDHGKYEGSSRAWSDAMMRGGCNANWTGE